MNESDRRPWGEYRDWGHHTRCLLKPMGGNGDDRLVYPEHVVDATLVGILAFAAVILADVLPTLLSGDPVFLTAGEILARAPTAALSFLLAFAFMWLRARGIDALAVLRDVLPGED